jgi:hypothetical protein
MGIGLNLLVFLSNSPSGEGLFKGLGVGTNLAIEIREMPKLILNY